MFSSRMQRLTLERVEETLRILKRLSVRLAPAPERIVLCVPTITTKEGDMANLQVACDSIVTIPIQVLDAEGQPVADPSGDTFTATIDEPAAATVAIGKDANGGPTLIITPTVQASPGRVATVSDSAGLASAQLTFDIVQDLAPKAIVLDAAGATTASQPVPSSPGP